MRRHPSQAPSLRRRTKKIVWMPVEAAEQPYNRLLDADDLLVTGSTAQLLRLMQVYSCWCMMQETTHQYSA
jgi:hypothetical protein